MNKLVEEIRSTFKSEIEMTFRANATLKYLSAVIEESLRMYPPFVTNLTRIVPKGGAQVDGQYIPEGVCLILITPEVIKQAFECGANFNI